MNKREVIDRFPCFGHFHRMHCMNLGYMEMRRDRNGIIQCPHCPLERLCRKETLKYAENCDVYNSGQIDKPRRWIEELKKG